MGFRDVVQSSFDDTKDKKLLFIFDNSYIMHNTNVVSGSFNITESMGVDGNIRFGTPITKELNVTLNSLPKDIIENSTEKEITVINLFEINKENLKDKKIRNSISILKCDTFFLLQFPEDEIVERYNLETMNFEREYHCQYRVDSMHCIDGTIYFAHKNQNVVSKVNESNSIELVELKEFERNFYDLNNKNIYIRNYKTIKNNIAIESDFIYKETQLFEEKSFNGYILGKFYYDKLVEKSNKQIEVKGLCGISKFNKDVSDWWNNLTFPKTIQEICDSLCIEVGCMSYPTSNFIVNNKPSTMTGLSGITVLKWIGEIIARSPGISYQQNLGKPTLIWSNIGTRVSILPVKNPGFGKVSIYKRNSLSFAEFKTKKIDKLQIRQTSDDIGVIVGNGSNTYIIEDNPFLYTNTDEAIRPIAEEIFNKIKDIEYIPFNVTCQYNPNISIANKIKIDTPNGTIETIVLSRVLSGNSSLMSEMSADGDETLEKVNLTNQNSHKKLFGKVNELVRTVEETKSTLTDNFNGFKTEFRQTANELKLQAEQTKYFNLIYNSDFELWENGKLKGWRDYSTNTLKLEMVDDSDFPTGKALRIEGQSGKTEYIFQEFELNKKIRYIFFSFDYKRLSHGTGGNAVGFNFYYKEKGNNTWLFASATSIASTLNKYQRLSFVFDFGTEKEITFLAPGIYYSSVGQISLINRVFMTTDLPHPPKELWNKRSADDVVSQISLLPDGVKISGSKVDVTGLVTFRNISDVNGQTVINGGKIQASVINAPILQNIKSINGVSVNATGDVTCVNWDGQLVKLRYNNGIVTNFYTFMSDSNSGGGINGIITINGNQLTFKGGILRKVITKGGSVMGTD